MITGVVSRGRELCRAAYRRPAGKIRRSVGSGNGPVLVGLSVVALALRLHRLGGHDLWLDEAISLHHATTRSISFLLFELPLLDPHPPLYFVVLNYWVGFAGTTTESALRLPSVVFGVAAVPLLFVFVRELYDRRVALLSATILALAPFHVAYSQEARMYTLLTLLTVASMLLFVRLQREFDARTLVGYLSVSALMGYTHVYGLFVLAAQGLVVLWGLGVARGRDGFRGEVKRWAGIQLCLAVLLSPWLLALVHRSLGGSPTPGGWLPAPDLRLVLGTPVLWVDAVGIHPSLVVLVPVSVVGVAFGLAPVLGHVRTRGSTFDRLRGLPGELWDDRSSRATLLLVALTVVPLALGIAISLLVTPIYYFRYTIVSSVGFYVLVAAGLARLDPRWVRRLAIGLLVVGLVSALPAQYAGGGPEPWEEVTTELERSADGDDLVVVTGVYKQAPFAYYWNDSEPTVRTVAEHPDRPVVVRERFERLPMAAVERRARAYDDVWLVLSHVSESHERELRAAVNASKTVSTVSEGETITVRVGR